MYFYAMYAMLHIVASVMIFSVGYFFLNITVLTLFFHAVSLLGSNTNLHNLCRTAGFIHVYVRLCWCHDGRVRRMSTLTSVIQNSVVEI